MKRYLSLILVLILLLPCLFVPASATTQGVINAINDQTDSLAEWLGVGLGEIRDYCSYIWDSICDMYSLLDSYIGSNVDFIATKIAELFDGGFFSDVQTSLNGLYDFFFTESSYTISLPQKDKNKGWILANTTIKLTPFEKSFVDAEFVGSLKTWYIDIGNAFFRDTTISPPIQAEADADATEASEYLDIMDDVTKPDEAELEELADISTHVDSGDVSELAAIWKPLFESTVFLPCIMLNLTFMLVGYVLFGKR